MLQGIVNNGHKRIHGTLSPPAVTPNGLIANYFGTVEDRKHDSLMLGDFGLSATTGTASKSQYSLTAWGSSLPLETTIITAQKMKFPSKISSVNVTKSFFVNLEILEIFTFKDAAFTHIQNVCTARKVPKYGALYGPYFPVFIQSECRKIRTRKNFVFGHFPRSGGIKPWQSKNEC